MSVSKWEGRYAVAADSVLVLAPSRRPWSLGIALLGSGGYLCEVTATPAAEIDSETGEGAEWVPLEAGEASDLITCDYPVTAIRVALTDAPAAVSLTS